MAKRYFDVLDVSDLVSVVLVLLDDEPPGVVALPEAEPLGAPDVSDDELLLDELPGAAPLVEGADEDVSDELLLDDALPGVLGAEPPGALLLLDELLPGALAGGLTVVLELDDDGA
ncbi:MAG TPA: hypothetical protein VFR86_23215 [Burkholderiaceae bacterium]|nr:hypothetical protein [Burkholderiaceae bacterium]